MLLWIGAGLAVAGRADAQAVFDEYARLEAQHDPAIVTLFSDDIRINSTLIREDGSMIPQPPLMGEDVQPSFANMMAISKAVGLVVEYQDLKINRIRGGYRITMMESSPTNCSDALPMVMELQRHDTTLRISRLDMNYQLTVCPPDDPALVDFTRHHAERLSALTPLALDEFTELTSVTASGNVLSYIYVVNDALLEAQGATNVQGALRQWASEQGCAVPMMPLVFRGVDTHVTVQDPSGAVTLEQRFDARIARPGVAQLSRREPLELPAQPRVARAGRGGRAPERRDRAVCRRG